MNKFRLLRADEIECRVAQIKENGLSLLLYKTARTDANLLDETVGFDRWQNDFKVVDGVLYGGIGIELNDGEWVWKWDAGVESNTEAEKGRASDAFKRAGFKFGIGRELYTAPFIWIPADKCNIKEYKGRLSCNDKFFVSEIAYNENQEISKLAIMVGSELVFGWKNGMKTTPPKAEPKSEKKEELIPMLCKDCRKEISDAEHNFSIKFYGAPYCRDCQKAHTKIG